MQLRKRRLALLPLQTKSMLWLLADGQGTKNLGPQPRPGEAHLPCAGSVGIWQRLVRECDVAARSGGGEWTVAVLLTCPEGHRWQAEVLELRAPLDQLAACPVCGSTACLP